jgi:hypothetical protein
MAGQDHRLLLLVASTRMPMEILQLADKEDRTAEEDTAVAVVLLPREAQVMGNGEMDSMCLDLRI